MGNEYNPFQSPYYTALSPSVKHTTRAHPSSPGLRHHILICLKLNRCSFAAKRFSYPLRFIGKNRCGLSNCLFKNPDCGHKKRGCQNILARGRSARQRTDENVPGIFRLATAAQANIGVIKGRFADRQAIAAPEGGNTALHLACRYILA